MNLSIPWPVTTDEPNTSPATEEELSEAMEEIRAKALKSDGYVSLDLREPVADELCKIIDAAGTGHCIVVPEEVTSRYDEETNCYIRTLIVCSTERKLNEHMDW